MAGWGGGGFYGNFLAPQYHYNMAIYIMVCQIAWIIASTLLQLTPRFRMTVSPRKKLNVNACTCFCGYSSARPYKLMQGSKFHLPCRDIDLAVHL